jgi:hypothetical protein
VHPNAYMTLAPPPLGASHRALTTARGASAVMRANRARTLRRPSNAGGRRTRGPTHHVRVLKISAAAWADADQKPKGAAHAIMRGYYRPSRHGPRPNSSPPAPSSPGGRELDPIEELLQRDGIEIEPEDRAAPRSNTPLFLTEPALRKIAASATFRPFSGEASQSRS